MELERENAAIGDKRDIVDALLSGRANVDARDYADNTALHLAAMFNRPDAVAVLLDAGADVTAGNRN